MTDPIARLPDNLPFIFISAWNDSGGGFCHRLFDGHPQLAVYPFELQLGTHRVGDAFKSWFHDKYRWPVFDAPDRMTTYEIFDAIIDDETKSVLREPANAKHSAYQLNFAMADWRTAFARRLDGKEHTRPAIVSAYVAALLDAWRERRTSGQERFVLGHCPAIVLDADLILAEMPAARMIHVVRSPVGGFVDMRRRRPEVDLAAYCRKWSMINTLGFAYAGKYPARVKTLRFIDLLNDRRATLEATCSWLGLSWDDGLMAPTWNGQPLAAMHPFGGVPEISSAHERACFDALSADERRYIFDRTAAARELFDLGEA
ncbi:sulfotransferase [Pseudolabrys sp. FHR47]|uniref:sulfotransferase n=1 Tax=Pseudolabrys sp. FHR47 TaxID=2562284 RepID=UPI0010BE6C45|nr:sulfotransferase [Pseudolabrys sp. FHR47]